MTEDDNILTSSMPIHLGMSSAAERTSSFKSYPKVLRHLIPAMVETGLFYSNHSDRVTCFQCGVHLHEWKLDSNPALTHSICIPSCFMARLTNRRQDDVYQLSPLINQIREIETNALPDQESDSSNLNRSICTICRKRTVNLGTIPCGHVLCSRCFIFSDCLWNCFFCRSEIKMVFKLYFP